MIDQLVLFANRHCRWVLVAVLGAAVTAAVVGTQLRFDALPDVTGKQVIVLTRAPGLVPEEVERLVTRPVEYALAGVPGLVRQRSMSRYGISSVTAIFGDDADLLRARQLVQERLQAVAADLPPGTEAPQLGPLTGGLGEIYQMTLTSPERTPAELLELAQIRVVPLLASVSGVVEVNSWGGERRTLDVVADPTLLAQRRITLEALVKAVSAATGRVPGATLESGEAGVLLRGVAWPRDADELAAAVVRVDDNGTVVRIGDVARVQEGAEPRIGTATADGQGETVYIMVQMLLEANALEVLDGVEARMADARQVLPRDVRVRVVYDRGDLVEATLGTVFTNLFEGGLLVILVLFLTLGSFRAGLVVASVIPLSMLGAAAGMVLFGVPGNLMSLGAIDFGLLVDGGVVMVEAVFHAVGRRPGALPKRALTSTVGMARPVFYSVLIVLLVYVPVLTLQGVEGKMFRPMALTVVLALATALVLSLTYVPAATQFFLRAADIPKREPFVIRLANQAYAPLLRLAMARPAAVAIFAAVLLGLGMVLFLRAGVGFIPQLDEGDLVVQTTRSPDIRVRTAAEMASRLEQRVIESVPEVKHVASRIGSPAVATDLMGIEQSDVFIDVAPRASWRDGLTRTQLIEEIEAAIAQAAPVDDVGFTQPIQMRFNELVGGSVTDVAVSLYGEDLDELHGLANRAREAITNVSGAEDVRVLAPPEVRLLEVRPRPLEAARQGMRTSEVLMHVQALRSGIEVGATYDGPLRIPVRVLLGAPVDALTIGSTSVPTRNGTLVPLARIAEVRRVRGPALIDHEMGLRRVVVGFNVRSRDLGSVVTDARAAVAERIGSPEGIRVTWGGQYESLRSARARLAVVIPVVLATIVLMLLVLFRSVRPALIILLNIPFAAVGGIVALSLRGLPVSVSASIGFIALSGIAVLNGVVLVRALLDEQGRGRSLADAAYTAATLRMRPVLMTALVAALGFVPMMLASGVGAEVQRPLATVVVGGLVTSTFLTLVILPALFPWLGRTEGASARRFEAFEGSSPPDSPDPYDPPEEPETLGEPPVRPAPTLIELPATRRLRGE